MNLKTQGTVMMLGERIDQLKDIASGLLIEAISNNAPDHVIVTRARLSHFAVYPRQMGASEFPWSDLMDLTPDEVTFSEIADDNGQHVELGLSYLIVLEQAVDGSMVSQHLSEEDDITVVGFLINVSNYEGRTVNHTFLLHFTGKDRNHDVTMAKSVNGELIVTHDNRGLEQDIVNIGQNVWDCIIAPQI